MPDFNKIGDLKPMSVIDYSAFKFYRENSKKRNPENTPNYVEHGKILSRFYEKIGQRISEHQGGVFIKDLGYFGGLINHRVGYRSYPRHQITPLNRETSGYRYFLTFVPIAKDGILKEWTADNSFSRKVTSSFSKALKSGIKFTFNAYHFIQRYASKQIL